MFLPRLVLFLQHSGERLLQLSCKSLSDLAATGVDAEDAVLAQLLDLGAHVFYRREILRSQLSHLL